jgi:bifunctional ADP-heptose synthase (sugar kinase/adenylyltransferase)
MRITVIGEKCIDEFVYGDCTRLNPEAPTPVFLEKSRKINLGMAGNVAENLISLGRIEISRFHQQKEIRKTRYVDETSNYILLRVDSENDVDRIRIDEELIAKIKESDLLVVSDYDKGYLYPEDLKVLAGFACFAVIDTKKPIQKIWAEEFDLIKMNFKEWDNPAHENKEDYLEKAIITQGKNGAIWNGNSYKGVEVEVMDVAGAGDSFLAGFAHKWVTSRSVESSIDFGNQIAAHVVKKRGVVNKIL